MSMIRQQLWRLATRAQSTLRLSRHSYLKLAAAPRNLSTTAHHGLQSPLAHGPEAAAWYASLERHIATDLKATSETTFEKREIPLPKTLHGLLQILENARRQSNVDLLAYISTSVQRWLDMDPIIGKLIEYCKNYDALGEDDSSVPYWAEQIYGDGRPLDEATRSPIDPNSTQSSYLRSLSLPNSRQSSMRHRILSQIWQSLGTMVVTAERSSSDNRTRRSIMAFFVDIVSQLHHNNAMPRTIYDYTSPPGVGILRRPPLVHCLSPRVMAQLSNASWTKQWLVEMEEHEQEGFKLPPPRAQPLLKPLENATWLDLILWSCIQGGWIHEASRIVSQITPAAGQAWAVVSWENLCRQCLPQHFESQDMEFQPERLQPSQMNDIGLIDMQPRTISREVVLTILDYIVMRPEHDGRPEAFSPESAVEYFRQTQSLLRGSDEDLSASTWNTLVFRLLDTATMTSHESPTAIENVVSLGPALENANQPNESVQAEFEGTDLDLSAWALGCQHRNLGTFARRSDENGLMRSLETIVNITDANRNLYIREFARQLRSMASSQNDVREHRPRHSPLLHPQIPLPVLADLLDFLTSNNVEGLGDFLFDRNEIDGGFIQSEDFGRTGIQPGLIEYAVSRENQEILTRVVEQLVSPIPLEVVHSLLRYRVATHQWPQVADILRQLSLSSEISWNAEDAMVIAAYALRLHGSMDEVDIQRGESALRVLIDMLQGSYDDARDPSTKASFAQVRLSNQIKRILQSVPTRFSDSFMDVKIIDEGRFGSPVRISPSAFHHLLSAVVERQGPIAGRSFLDHWCQDPGEPLSNEGPIFSLSETTERVVKLTPPLIGTIIKPITRRLNQKLRELDSAQWQSWEQIEGMIGLISERELHLLRWAISVYRALRIESSAFERILPGAHNLLAFENEGT